MGRPKLYYHPLSPNSRRVRAVAIQVGMGLEEHVVDVLKGEHKAPAFLRINPNGLVPALDDDGFVLWESNAIVQYLAEKKGDTPMWPRDLRVRADITRWQFWASAHFATALETFTFEHLLKRMMNAGAPDTLALRRAEEVFHRFASVLDRHLDGRTHLVGGCWTIADFAVGSSLMYAADSRLPLGEYAHIVEWYGRLSQLDAWQRTTPELP